MDLLDDAVLGRGADHPRLCRGVATRDRPVAAPARREVRARLGQQRAAGRKRVGHADGEGGRGRAAMAGAVGAAACRLQRRQPARHQSRQYRQPGGPAHLEAQPGGDPVLRCARGDCWRDGQRVRAGQALVELDPTISTAEAVQAQKALQTALLDAARGRAILSALDGHGLAFVAPSGTPPDVAATQLALALAQLANIQATAGTHRADQQASIAARAEARIQAAKLTETLPLLDEQIAANEQLLAKGYVSKLKVIEMRRQRLAAARDRDAAIETANKATAQMAGAGSDIVQGNAEARARVLTELAKAESDAKLRREELAKAVQKSSLQTLVSPVSGTVSQLAIHTVGGVVEATKPVMVIVPDGGVLVADVKILNRDVGFVKVGQAVAVKLEAFPFTRYGALPGKIQSVGSDAVEDEKLGLVYPAKVSLDGRSRLGRKGNVRASVGMQITADIRTGRRTILSYLMSPIDEASQEAGRER